MAPNPRILRYGKAAIAEGATLIRAGQPVAVPTETVYGLAADARNGDAVARIYAAKGRPSFNPLIVHVADIAMARRLGRFDDVPAALTDCWPGPLTIVVPLRDDSGIASIVTAGLSTIAIRVPAHRAMRALIAATAVPLAAPSANASGRISATSAAHVAASLGNRIALIIDDGPAPVGIESTIVRATGGPPSILRPGPILFDLPMARGGAVIAPGMLASHYAPIKPVRLNAVQALPGEWLIGFGPVRGDDSLSLTGDPAEAASRLFDALHRADASAARAIAVAPVTGDGLAVAIRDRLARAAA
jgi:L-threonylcarbamoyladenylate synthase